MSSEMYAGMAAIILGVGIAAYGLLPRDVSGQLFGEPRHCRHTARGGVAVLGTLDADVGARRCSGNRHHEAREPRLHHPGHDRRVSSDQGDRFALPFSALVGTVIGSIAWGALADIYGRKATILLSAVMFVGTSICGAMPSLAWNVGMCFMMGAAAGGMLPVTYALLAEMMPSKHRGWASSWSAALAPPSAILQQAAYQRCCSRSSAGAFCGCSISRLASRWFSWCAHPRIGEVPARARPTRRSAAGDGALWLTGSSDQPCRANGAAERPGGGTYGARIFRQAFRAKPRRDLLRPDQFWTIALAPRRSRKQGL